MMKNFTQSLLKAAAFATVMCGAAFTAQAADDAQKLYLSDVYTEAELNSDIFGVPMRIDNLGGSKYEANYYNQKKDNQVYILGSKTNFSDVYGDDGEGKGALSNGSALDEVSPIVLPDAGKYYKITLDTDEMTYSVSTYEVADYMDPVFWELGSENLNVWWNFTPGTTGGDNDNWEHNPGTPAVNDEGEEYMKDAAWVRTLYFGYTCSEYLINENNEYVDAAGNVVEYDKEAGIDKRVMATKLNPLGEEVNAEQLRWCEPWTVDANNPHLYTWTNPKHFVAGQKLNFIIHNWHEAGWWNYITWRVDEEEECDIFYYYGGVVKQAYLDWAYGKGNATVSQWQDEGARRTVIFGEGEDCWCKPVVQTTGEYVLQFDSHLGRAKLVPAGSIVIPDPSGITSAVADENAPVEYYSLQGIRVNNPANGIYIRRQGKKATKVLF